VGTPGLIEGSAQRGDMPTKNWHSAVPAESLDLEGFRGQAVLERQAKKWGCWKCSLACGGVMQNVYEEGINIHSHKPEYETIAALGPMCNNDDLESIIKGGDICNLYGHDTISAGATIAFAMDLYDRGIITEKETGVDLSWGNADGILEMLELMGKREGFVDVLADGVKVAAEKIGKNAAEFAYHVQGQELPMHDPK
jgi:aldehyde:ferredoxin oxidoreductase